MFYGAYAGHFNLHFYMFINTNFVHFRSVKYQEQLWEISINIIKDWLSVMVLDQYGPTMGFEEEENFDDQGTTPMLSFHDDEQVLISENNGVSARVSFRKSTIDEEDVNGADHDSLENERHSGGVGNGHSNTDSGL